MSAEVSLEIPAADYVHLQGEDRNDFMFAKRGQLLDALEKTVTEAGGTFLINKVHLMAAENEASLLIQGSHP